ncbi:MAG: efflux RND transporter periplasmic adaptor subunit [Anaerolineales bacterium]|jgi:HlyD family secretion protein|nr:efflux RND transporter periplasmic adaptor subunit [Anaerolineales bacterium]
MFKNRTFWIVVVVLAIAAAAYYFTIGRSTAADGTVYETQTAARGTLTANVGATGTVRAGQSAVLIWQTGGRVEVVNALIGQQVSQDEVLASLLQTSLSQGIILAEADLVTAQKNLDNVLQSKLALAQAEQNLVNARQAVRDGQENLTKLDYRRASDNLIQQTQANIDLSKKNVALAESAYKTVQNRPDGDSKKAQALLELTKARQELTTQTNNLNWYTGTPSDLDAEKYRAALSVAEAQLADAEREVTRLKDGPTADDVAAAEARVAAAQATLNQSRIIAPFNGTVTSSQLQPGDVVTAGFSAFRVDDLSHLLVDLQISEVDINDIKVAQLVTLSFDAIQSKAYNGKVIKVNQAGDSTTGAVNFTVTVELTDADALVKPGMTAAVNITVKEIKDALIVPNRAVRVVDGQRVVYVLKDGALKAVNIRLGASSESVSEVVGGDLVEGSLVVLNPPAVLFGPGSGGPPAGMRGN